MRVLPVLLLAAAATLAPAPRAHAVVVGQPAPDFTLQDGAGQSHRLSDLRGHVVLLAFVGWG
jgi:cytochrome oxidase Cu insertion factor (SCO1/SenC/PrrC family)